MSAEAQIKSFVDRVLRLKEEQDTIGQDIRDIYAEAKSLGFDKTQLGNVVSHVRKVEKKGRDAINEGNAIFDMYLAAYEGSHTHAPARARENIEEFPAAKGAKNGGTYLLHVERTNHEQRHEARVPSADGRGEGADESAQGQGSGTPGTDRHGGPVAGTLAGEDEDGRSGHVGREARHEVIDPETGEILESVQSHEALVLSAPAESASGEISATNQPETAKDSPHHLVPTRGDDAAMASSQQEGATGRQPVDTLRAGRTGSITVTAGETASIQAGPQIPAVPGGEPSIPSPDADGAKMDSVSALPGQPDDESVFHIVQSRQAANNSEPVKRGHPLRPLCRYPGEDRCAGYGSVTCHACLRAAREDEAAA